ncbi:hypothetical protein RBY4I_2364 [Rhodobacterales bacterium Y4I]|nr:hypothetical protein RBY4I_2364 [Rhodobacterales bacterium Y4I]
MDRSGQFLVVSPRDLPAVFTGDPVRASTPRQFPEMAASDEPAGVS